MILLVLIALVTQPDVYWSRVTPTNPRQLWVYGEGLWAGPVEVSRSQGTEDTEPTARIGDMPLVFRRLRGGNANEGNFALPYLQTYELPKEVLPGPSVVEITRNDGECYEVSVVVPEAPTFRHYPMGSGPLTFPEQSAVIEQGIVHDAKGAVIVCDAGYGSSRPVVTMRANSSLANLTILVERSAPRVSPIQITGDGVRLFNVRVSNYHDVGYGLDIYGGTSGSSFECCTLHAERPVWVNPGRGMHRNTWVGMSASAPRGSANGEISRVINGSENLFAWCQWHDIDRGPTSQSGQKVDSNVFFECQQYRTGTTVGGSEGIFFEQGRGFVAEVLQNGQTTLAVNVPAALERYCQVGQTVAMLDGSKTWAFIERITSTSTRTRVLHLSKPVSGAPGNCWVGGASTRNLIARCDFRDGRGGTIVWGPSIENRFIGNVYRGMNWCRVQAETAGERPNNGGIGFVWGERWERNKIFNCGAERVSASSGATIP